MQIIEWFKDYRTSLSSAEQEALALDVDDVVLMKIRHILLDSEEGEWAGVNSYSSLSPL